MPTNEPHLTLHSALIHQIQRPGPGHLIGQVQITCLHLVTRVPGAREEGGREDMILWFQRAGARPVCSPTQNRELPTNSKWQTNKRLISTNLGYVILYSLSNTCLGWLQMSEMQSKKLKQRQYISCIIKVRRVASNRAEGLRLSCLAWFIRQPLCLW